MRKSLALFALLAVLMIPSAYGMGTNYKGCEHSEHGNVMVPTLAPIVEKRIPLGMGLELVISSGDITLYHCSKEIMRIALPPYSKVGINPLDRSLVVSSPTTIIIFRQAPPGAIIYFRESSFIKAQFFGLKKENPSYYYFGNEGIRGIMVLLKCKYEEGKIVGEKGSSVLISLFPKKLGQFPIWVLRKIRAQISLIEKEGKLQVSFYSSSNFTMMKPNLTPFGIKLGLEKNPPGIIEVTLPSSMGNGGVMVLYNGLPMWQASTPQDLNSTSDSYWMTQTQNGTVIYVSVNRGGTVYIIPEKKLRELKFTGIGVGSAISAALLLVLFRRL